jgi:hypothetical protein
VPDGGLRISRAQAPLVVADNWLYSIGGLHDLASRADVERAPLNASGLVSSFATVPTVAMTIHRLSHNSVVLGRWLYLIGGWNHIIGQVASVERAAINRDGSLASFTPVPGVTLKVPRGDATVAIVGNSLYVIGGFGQSWWLDSVERATINADGSLCDFAIVPGVTLVTSREGPTSAVVGRWLYVLGGRMSSAFDDVERAAISDDGSLSSFAKVDGVVMKSARVRHSSVVVGDWLYLIGGESNFNPETTASVERASILADGSLSTFDVVSTSTWLVNSREWHASTVVGSSVYALGGVSDGYLGVPFVLRDTVERASFSGDGSLSGFAIVAGATLGDGGRYRFTSIVIGNRLCTLGGFDGRLESNEGVTSCADLL